jgi:hypothetical protein
MKERPILFSGPMVRAILAGTKTQTRRIVTHRHGISFLGGMGQTNDPACLGYAFDGPDHNGYMVLARGLDERHDHGRISLPCPYGAPGDRLWVREAWCSGYARGCWGTVFAADKQFVQGSRRHEKGVHFNAEWDGPGGQHYKWRPSIHMPRWASRLTLEVTDVRVERLHDITEEDARAEGVEAWMESLRGGPHYNHNAQLGAYPVTAFARLWDSINGERAAWHSNPWVWVVAFRRVAVEAGR